MKKEFCWRDKMFITVKQIDEQNLFVIIKECLVSWTKKICFKDQIYSTK